MSTCVRIPRTHARLHRGTLACNTGVLGREADRRTPETWGQQEENKRTCYKEVVRQEPSLETVLWFSNPSTGKAETGFLDKTSW